MLSKGSERNGRRLFSFSLDTLGSGLAANVNEFELIRR